MRFTLDSNVLIYAADARDRVRQAVAIEILRRAARKNCVLVPQALSEFFHATTRKGIVPRVDAMAQLRRWVLIFEISPGPTAAAVLGAAEAAATGRFQYYDALLLLTARAAGCAAVLTEDMGDGALLEGIEIVAAFAPTGELSTRAAALL